MNLLFPTSQESESLIFIYLHGIHDFYQYSSGQGVIVKQPLGYLPSLPAILPKTVLLFCCFGQARYYAPQPFQISRVGHPSPFSFYQGKPMDPDFLGQLADQKPFIFPEFPDIQG
jgi:hypothetical protein